MRNLCSISSVLRLGAYSTKASDVACCAICARSHNPNVAMRPNDSVDAHAPVLGTLGGAGGRMESQQSTTSPSFPSLEWRGSIVLLSVELLETALVALSPIAWIAHFRRKPLPMWLVDLWVAALCAASVFLVFLFTTFDESWRVIAKWTAVYLLLESLGVLLRDLILSPLIYEDEFGAFVGVRDPRRWVILAPIGLIPVILGFAILHLFYGDSFKPPILEPMQAVYFSMVN